MDVMDGYIILCAEICNSQSKRTTRCHKKINLLSWEEIGKGINIIPE